MISVRVEREAWLFIHWYSLWLAENNLAPTSQPITKLNLIVTCSREFFPLLTGTGCMHLLGVCWLVNLLLQMLCCWFHDIRLEPPYQCFVRCKRQYRKFKLNGQDHNIILLTSHAIAVTSDGISDANAGRKAAPTCKTHHASCLTDEGTVVSALLAIYYSLPTITPSEAIVFSYYKWGI